MKVRVDASVCVGHGRCYTVAPTVFDADEAGHSLVLDENVPPALEDDARKGAAECLEQAITIED